MTESVRPPVSVVIPVRNGSSTLGQQLQALSVQDYEGAFEVVVVDNASTDDTAMVAIRWAHRLPALRVVHEAHVGPNAARNSGIRAAHGDLILLCDADDQVAVTWVHEMTSALRGLDVVGGALEYRLLNAADVPDRGRPQESALRTAFGQPYSMSAALGMRRPVFDAIGGFDESFSVGGDDVDFCLRAQQAGFSIGFAPGAVVHYRLKHESWAFVRQQLTYGRGAEALAAKYDNTELVGTAAHRAKILAVRAASLARRAPALAHQRSRVDYVAEVAYVIGSAQQLVARVVRGRRSTRTQVR